MSFQFCCPQGHVLQGELSQVGQLFQCPMCGSSFLIPSFPFGPAAAPAESPPQSPATAPQSETDKPRFDLGFDPDAKESLPFELPGQSGAEAEQPSTAGLPAFSFPAPSFLAPSFPAPSFLVTSLPEGSLPESSFPAPAMPAPTFEPSVGGQDFLQSAPPTTEEEVAPQDSPKVLHIRCPSGHLVKAKSDLLGKNGRCPACKKTFELRYEDSVEFQRRKEKILRREENKTGRAWIAGALLAAFLVFAGLVGLIIALNK